MNRFGEFGVGSRFGESEKVRPWRTRHFHSAGTDGFFSLRRAVGQTTDNHSMMEGKSVSSTQRDGEAFVWNPSIVSYKSNVTIGEFEYHHPFPSRKDASQCWNFFRCRLNVDYKSLNFKMYTVSDVAKK
jgi:hypothetical protein